MKLLRLLTASTLLATAFSPAMAQDEAKKPAKEKPKAARPFSGKHLNNWVARDDKKGANKWVVGTPSIKDENQKTFDIGEAGKPRQTAMINNVAEHGESWDIASKKKFGDCRIELDVMVPKGANSGIYVMGEYEIQVLDSYGKEEIGNGDMGAIYGAGAAKVNASKKPGEWQKYSIRWQAPKFNDAGEKTANAKFLAVRLNGKVVQKDVEMKGPTPGGLTGKEAATGPIMFQGNHGPVAYRNIRVFSSNARAAGKKKAGAKKPKGESKKKKEKAE
jgi:hypothetical protein